jgi:O-antigen/teichoic acid export membrane protein
LLGILGRSEIRGHEQGLDGICSARAFQKNNGAADAMSQVKSNLAANFLGRFTIAIVGIISVPLYVRFLGIEAYGLLGVFATLQAAFAIVGNGLTSTMIREIARLSSDPSRAQEARNFARSLEIVHWLIGVIIAIPILLAAPLLAKWVNSGSLSPTVIRQGIIVVALVIMLQSPQSLYDGGLIGLQKQVVTNVIGVFAALIRSIGAILLLKYVAPSLQLFLLWQLVSTLLQLAVSGFSMWRFLPPASRPASFQLDSLRKVSRFAAGVSASTILTLGLTQGDKVILSRLLSLESFGYYMLATTAASGLQYLVGPLFVSYFPRFSQLTGGESQPDLASLYHRACQIASVMIIPAAVMLALFSREVMFLWTRDPGIAQRTYPLVSLLVIGIALNGLSHLPYALQLAFGWTRLAFYWNLLAVTALIPLMIAAARTYGAIGAASIWVSVNATYIFVVIPVMHRRLLKPELRRWYGVDVGIPLASASLVAGTARLLIGSTLAYAPTLSLVIVTSFATLLTAAISTPATRNWISGRMKSQLVWTPRVF